MTADNADDLEPTIFSAVITPHRSLGRTGFLLLMGFFGLISFVAGMVFLIAGAWPVFGFFGLDVALLYWAFRLNYRHAGAYEEVTVTPSALTVRKVSHRGRARDQKEPLDTEFLVAFLVELDPKRIKHPFARGKQLIIANFLGPHEKASFAKEVDAALSEVKRGVTRTALD